MAFLPCPALPQNPRRTPVPAICANYLLSDAVRISYETSKTGSFGAVFFGEYADPANPTGSATDVVVKCPINTKLGMQLYGMEKHTNLKVRRTLESTPRFAEFVGEVIIPPESQPPSGFARLGLVWRRVGNGDTMEDYLNSLRISMLASALGTIGTAAPLRRQLTAALFRELALVLSDLQSCGIVHRIAILRRDVKPENLLVVQGDAKGAPLKAIDFGSSCDWGSPFKKGIGLATCDPVYAAPERTLDVFQPGFRFDVYSIGLIALRCALPSLTDKRSMDMFVSDNLSKFKYSFTSTCSAIVNGRAQVPQSLLLEMQALNTPQYEDMYALFTSVLTPDPKDRATVADCLNSRFLRGS